jgi:hypothetical protein
MNKTTITGIISFFIIGLLVGSQLHGCIKGRGTKGGGRVNSDTVLRYVQRTDTLWHTMELTNNIPYTVWGHDTIIVVSGKSQVASKSNDSVSSILRYVFVSDTVAYSDTLRRANEFKAEIFDTLAGNRIIGRSLRWANLAPIEVKTVTNTVMKKEALVKVFLGADMYGGKEGTNVNLDLAPAASVVFRDRYMLDLGYYIFHQQVTAGLKVKLSFGK